MLAAIKYEVRRVTWEWDNVRTTSIRKIPYIRDVREEHPIIEKNKAKWVEGEMASCCLSICCGQATLLETDEAIAKHNSWGHYKDSKTPVPHYKKCGHCNHYFSERKGFLHGHMSKKHAAAAKEKQD